MIEKLLELQKNSYVPISNFPVSSIVVTKDNNTFYGVNVEDASTRAGTCAERNAIYNAVTNGYKQGDFKELHVMVSSGKIGTPCFVCRQALYDYMNLDTKVICYSDMGEVIVSLADLCTYGFGENDLQQH